MILMACCSIAFNTSRENNFRAKQTNRSQNIWQLFIGLIEDRIIGECKSIKVARPVTSLDEMARSVRK